MLKKQELITVTEEAQKHFDKIVKQFDATGVRLSLQEAGCTGFKYCWEYIKGYDHNPDYVLNFGDWDFVVHYQDMKFLAGSIIDLKRLDFGTEIVVESPQLDAQCGCGESVSFKV